MTLAFDAHPRSSLIVALDFDSLSSAVKFAKQVADLVGMFRSATSSLPLRGLLPLKKSRHWALVFFSI